MSYQPACDELNAGDVEPGLGAGEGRLEVPVTHTVPAKIMGSGIGHTHSNSGDYDIQLFDGPTVKDYGLKLVMMIFGNTKK